MRILLFISIILFSFSDIKEASAQAGSMATDGVYVPRLTKSQRDAIANPGTGQMIYNTDDNCFNIYQKDAWQNLCGFDVSYLGNWTQKANAGGGNRMGAVGFAIGNKGYIGTGDKGGIYSIDFWEYDPATDIWTQKADFGGVARVGATGFSIGSKGYIGTGYGGGVSNNDFWEYDPATNIWTQKANAGSRVRAYAVGFSIGSKGYLGTGAFNGGSVYDFWEYDPATDIWTQKANVSHRIRANAVGFSMGGKGYVGTGFEGNGHVLDDFWEYDPIANNWSQKASFGGGFRLNAVGFAIGNKGYITTGTSSGSGNDLWEYDLITNRWTPKVDFGGASRTKAVSFSIGNKAYIGTGSAGGNYRNDFWEYNPESDNITKQGNMFNGVAQLIKLDTSGNLALKGDLNMTGNFTNPNFIAPTLLNSWINYDVANGYGAAGYAKNKHSIVQLKGLIKNGVIDTSTVLFILPEGYRPTEIMIFAVVNSNGTGRVDVYPNGEVRIISGSNAFLSFDNISFRAGQ